MKIGKMYKKSLRDLLKGPLAIHDKRDIVRYRNLEKLGLVAGVGIRCVSLTKAGKLALATGETKDEVIYAPPPVASRYAIPAAAPVVPAAPPPPAIRWDSFTLSANTLLAATRFLIDEENYIDF